MHAVTVHRQFVARETLYDGQALLFYETQPRSVSLKVPDLEHSLTGTNNGGKSFHLLVLTVFSIVDPAGHPVHPDAEMPFARDHAPPPAVHAVPGVPLDDRPFDVPSFHSQP